MQEIGIDLMKRTPTLLTRELGEEADVIVTMGCGDECPAIPGKQYIDWDLPDPAGQRLTTVRQIRNEINTRVGDLIARLDQPADKASD